MKATFNNRLEIVQTYEGKRRVLYRHTLRCGLKLFIEKAKPQTNKARPAPERDWEIVLEGGSPAALSEFKSRLAADLARYLLHRVKKSAVHLTYRDIEKLAALRSID